MVWPTFACAFSCLCLAVQAPQPGGNEQELQKFQGDWLVTDFVMEGRKISQEQVELLNLIYSFEGTKCRMSRQGKLVEDAATIQIDPSKSPKTIEIRKTAGDGKGNSLKAIYEIKDGQMRLCYFRGGDKWPVKFSEDAILVTLKKK